MWNTSYNLEYYNYFFRLYIYENKFKIFHLLFIDWNFLDTFIKIRISKIGEISSPKSFSFNFLSASFFCHPWKLHETQVIRDLIVIDDFDAMKIPFAKYAL